MGSTERQSYNDFGKGDPSRTMHDLRGAGVLEVDDEQNLSIGIIKSQENLSNDHKQSTDKRLDDSVLSEDKSKTRQSGDGKQGLAFGGTGELPPVSHSHPLQTPITPVGLVKHERRIRKLEALKEKFHNVKAVPEHQEIAQKLRQHSQKRQAQRDSVRRRIHQQNMAMFQRLINAKPTTAFQDWQDAHEVNRGHFRRIAQLPVVLDDRPS